MRTRTRRVLRFGGVGIAIVICYIVFAMMIGKGQKVAEFRLVNQQYLVVLAPRWFEVSQPLFYELRDGPEIIVPKTYFGSLSQEASTRDLDLRVLTARDGRIVALIETTDPSVILVLYDVDSGEYWPRPWEDSVEFYAESTLKESLKILDRVHPSREGYRPSWDTAYNSNRKIN